MSVSAKDLTVWSFLVASAHGAGLMVLPFVLGTSVAGAHAHSSHMQMAAMPDVQTAGILATLLHSASYLAVAGAIAWLFYKKLGSSAAHARVDQRESDLGGCADRYRVRDCAHVGHCRSASER